MKYKKGDKVRVVLNPRGNDEVRNALGHEGVVIKTEVTTGATIFIQLERNTDLWFFEDEIQMVKPKKIKWL